MEIEGFSEVINTIVLAKELHDIGRSDIVRTQFFDTLCYDTWLESMFGVISCVFSGFYNKYDENDEAEMMLFTDDVISDYFTYAREFGVKTNTPYDKNPFVADALDEVRQWLGFCYSIDWKLLGYTKTRNTAKQSKLIVYIGACDCDCHNHLAYSLIQIYKWFSDKCAEFTKPEEVMAA